MRIERAALVAALVLAGCMPRQTRPLDLTLDASAGLATGDQIGDPIGGGARIGIDWLELSASAGVAEARRFGVPCSGLVNPDDPNCVAQPIEQQSEIARFGFGPLWFRPAGRNRLVFSPYIGGAYVAHEERGLQTGGRRDAGAAAWQLGGRAGFQRNLVAGLWLGLSADAALIVPIRFECDDCYDPFRESFSVGTLSLSASWRLP